MATPATPLPPVVFEDGLGQRRRVVGARNQTLSVLFLDGEMTADPAFETALRDRIAQLAGFHHDAFARARGVVHVTKTPLRLALASDFVEGWRLSEMLALADERLIPLEITAAYSVIHQLAVPASGTGSRPRRVRCCSSACRARLRRSMSSPAPSASST